MPPDVYFIVQDVSNLVGIEPSYTPQDYGSPSWEVVALCADQPTLQNATSIEIAIIPALGATEDVTKNAREGAYADSVTCDERPYRSSQDQPR